MGLFCSADWPQCCWQKTQAVCLYCSVKLNKWRVPLISIWGFVFINYILKREKLDFTVASALLRTQLWSSSAPWTASLYCSPSNIWKQTWKGTCCIKALSLCKESHLFQWDICLPQSNSVNWQGIKLLSCLDKMSFKKWKLIAFCYDFSYVI